MNATATTQAMDLHARFNGSGAGDRGDGPMAMEHVVIEGLPEEPVAEGIGSEADTVKVYRIDSPFHRRSTELSLLAGHYLWIRSTGPDHAIRDYQFDLRFLADVPVRIRRIAWSLGSLVPALAAAAVLAAWLAWHSDEATLVRLALAAGACGVAALAVLASIAALRRTTETLELRSLHGHVALARLTGGLGSSRRHTGLFVDLVRGAREARAERPREHRQFLCDEMRAHHRLHEMGILSAADYEAGKLRILAAHDQDAPSPSRR